MSEKENNVEEKNSKREKGFNFFFFKFMFQLSEFLFHTFSNLYIFFFNFI